MWGLIYGRQDMAYKKCDSGWLILNPWLIPTTTSVPLHIGAKEGSCTSSHRLENQLFLSLDLVVFLVSSLVHFIGFKHKALCANLYIWCNISYSSSRAQYIRPAEKIALVSVEIQLHIEIEDQWPGIVAKKQDFLKRHHTLSNSQDCVRSWARRKKLIWMGIYMRL